MLVRQGEERSNGVDQRLAAVLAAIAGALNAAAFHAVGFFSANMTGNASSFSDRLSTGQFGAAVWFLGIILLFVLGAATSTLLVNAGSRRGMRSIYAISILAEGGLLSLLGLAEVGFPSLRQGALLILGLAFLMGIQNAVVTRISNSRVRTTHISGMATDIGIELGILIDVIFGREPRKDAQGYLDRLRLHLVTISAFMLGGVAGVALYLLIGSWLFVASGLLLLGIAISALASSRHATSLLQQ